MVEVFPVLEAGGVEVNVWINSARKEMEAGSVDDLLPRIGLDRYRYFNYASVRHANVRVYRLRSTGQCRQSAFDQHHSTPSGR